MNADVNDLIKGEKAMAQKESRELPERSLSKEEGMGPGGQVKSWTLTNVWKLHPQYWESRKSIRKKMQVCRKGGCGKLWKFFS